MCATLPQCSVADIQDSRVITLSCFRTVKSTFKMSKIKKNKSSPFFPLIYLHIDLMNLKEM